MMRKKVKGLIREEKMKFCPLWSLFDKESRARQPCIKEECGMYGLCNPFAAEQKEKAEEESKELKTFGGGK